MRLAVAVLPLLLALAACPPRAAVSQPGGGAGGADAGAPDADAPDADAPDADAPDAGQPAVLWAQSVGDGSDQSSHGVSLDASGAVLWAGQFEGDVSFADGGTLSAGADSDGFVARLSPAGDALWARAVHGGLVVLSSLAAGADGGGVLAGRFSNALTFTGSSLSLKGQGRQAFALTFSADGDGLWGGGFGAGAGDRLATGVALDAAGGVLLAGRFTGQVSFGCDVLASAPTDTADVFLASLGPDHACRWSARAGSASAEAWAEIAVDRATGESAALFHRCAGTCGGATLQRLDASGHLLWEKTLEGVLGSREHVVAVGSAGQIVLAGALVGTGLTGLGCDVPPASGMRTFVAALDGGGVCAFARAFGGAGSSGASALALAPSGALVIAGVHTGKLDFVDLPPLQGAADGAVFWAELGSAGAVTRAGSFPYAGEPGTLDVGGVATDGKSLVVAGTFAGTLRIGARTLTSAGGTDAFVAALGL